MARANELSSPVEAITTVRGDGAMIHNGAIQASGHVSITPQFPNLPSGSNLLGEESQKLSGLSIDGRAVAQNGSKRKTYREADTMVRISNLIVYIILRHCLKMSFKKSCPDFDCI